MSPEAEDTTVYTVVVNHEEQYSIWPADRELPGGWREAGKVGLKDECLAHIEEVWTDMRPLSLRRQMEEWEAQGEPEVELEPVDDEPSLPERLADGEHPVELTIRAGGDAQSLREEFDRGYVYVKFTDTRGGTELGVRLDREASDLAQADFDAQTGTIRVVGGLTLDFYVVRCVAEVDLTTRRGTGHLEILEAPSFA